MSALAVGRTAGRSPLMASVWRNRRPVAGLAAHALGSGDAVVDVVRGVALTSSSRKRLAWRALRATSDMPFLSLSSSSSIDHRQVDVVLLEAEQAGRVVHQHVGVEHEQLGACLAAGARLCVVDMMLLRESGRTASTSSAWPSTLTPRHSRRSTPLRSSTKVLRSMPRTCLPYMFFFDDAEQFAGLFVGIGQQRKGKGKAWP